MPCKRNFINVEDKQVIKWSDVANLTKLEAMKSFARKDTVIVPFGGYTVIRFIVDNPGWWFLHCPYRNPSVRGYGWLLLKN